MNFKRKSNNVMSEINITPFTDVILVLLIIFMITTPMLMQSSIKVDLPKAQTSDIENSLNVDVIISKDGCIYIDGNQIHVSNIEEMQRLLLPNINKTVIIKGDKDVKYDYIVQFLDVAKKIGVKKFVLAVDKS
ncbi:MAG: biopolymer transporter ExbD [Endomicrobium sp.]|nr:biopolymer transporter ExbD [Endomicrobium sp.]